ncbi:hypothetical protein HY440_01995 [Candidatus Microgenomates bacterium]|nr:hypothetical protein [Candidatus Microgenomates bacterium]
MIGKKGQISVLVLLLSMLGLVVSLSVASRSISDLKQTSYVDSGTKTLAAAEAGLQYAFANQSSWPAISGTDCSSAIPINGLSLSGIAANGLSYVICGTSPNSVTVRGVLADDVVQIELPQTNNNFKAMDVSWSGDASVEITVIDQDNGNNYSQRRYAYNPHNLARTNGFAPGQVGSNCAVGRDVSNASTIDCDMTFTSGSCTGVGEILKDYANPSGPGQLRAQSLRIKPLYKSADITLCGRSNGNSQVALALQYYSVTVTATSTNGTVRRLQASYFPPALPAIFDNVLYSGGNIAK